jgi:hypothetical protein
MNNQEIKQHGNEASNVIEDLTLNETEVQSVKGGANRVVDSFGFGVEREMKESG